VSKSALKESDEIINSDGDLVKDPVEGPKEPIQPEPGTVSDSGPRILDEPVGPSVGSKEEIVDNPFEASEPQLPDPAPTPKVIEETPEPIVEDPSLSNEEIIAMMKTSVKKKKVKEFSFKSVTKWVYAGPQQINGQEYQVGEVSYSDKTIFGDQKLKALALFDDGDLVKWVWPTTHDKMK